MQTSIPDLSRLTRPRTLAQGVMVLGITVVSILTMPSDLSGGDITMVLIAGMLTALSLMAALSTDIDDAADILLTWRLAAFGSAIIAVALSIVVTPLSGLILGAIITLTSWLLTPQPLAARLILLALIPSWVWIAGECWSWQLLMLIPLLVLALLALAQLRDAEAWPDGTERIMSARAHRYAGWLVIALAGVLIMIVGLLSDVHKPYLALAGVVLAMAIPLEAGFGSTDGGMSKTSHRIVISAFVVASVSWLIGIA